MFRRKWPGVAAGAALALLGPLVLGACGSSSSSSSTLTLGVITPATTFEATDMNWGNESPYNQAVYDSLVQASPTGVIEPHLATAWSYNAAKTVLTMTLRTGVKFTDGTPFNASVAAENLEAFQKGTSNNASDLAYMASATAVSPTKLVISACGGSSGSSSTLTLGVITPATTFEAPDMNWANESPYNQAVYDTLLQASPTGAIEPHLATAWSYNASKTVLTLTLRTGVKFTDGTPFNASVAAANLDAFQKGTSNNASDLVNMASATAVSPTKLVIRLKQPDPAFLTYLGEAAGSQESPKAWKSPTASDGAGRLGSLRAGHQGHGRRQLLCLHGQPELLG